MVNDNEGSELIDIWLILIGAARPPGMREAPVSSFPPDTVSIKEKKIWRR